MSREINGMKFYHKIGALSIKNNIPSFIFRGHSKVWNMGNSPCQSFMDEVRLMITYDVRKYCWLNQLHCMSVPVKEAIYQATVNGRSATQYGIIATIDLKSHS